MRSNSSWLDLSGVVSQMQEQLQLEMLLSDDCVVSLPGSGSESLRMIWPQPPDVIDQHMTGQASAHGLSIHRTC